MRLIHVACVMVAAVAAAVPVLGQQAEPAAKMAAPVVQAKPIVQIAVLLDTSNSMDGLIEQAKTQLWKIVNEFAKAERGGVRPEIQVALYQYGTPSLGAETGFIKQLTPLTDDLDKVSDELFKLKTNGGDEYCGAVIRKATEELKWSEDKTAYKAIFIAGNEPFTQGPVEYQSACREAIAKGILVNTIFCGKEEEGVNLSWKAGAVMADGSFMSINQDKVVAQVAAPQDKELAALGTRINSTYVTYGAKGEAGAGLQQAQDQNAAGAGRGGRGGRGAGGAAPMAAAAERATAKANGVYRNGSWDLVDAVKDQKVDLKQMKEEELPEPMRKLDQKGREEYVAAMAKEREEIQKEIQKLSAERDAFLVEQRKTQAGESTLDSAIITTVRTQAKQNGMSFGAK